MVVGSRFSVEIALRPFFRQAASRLATRLKGCQMQKPQQIQSRLGVHLLSSELPPSMQAQEVYGLVHSTAIIGANFIKDFFARVADVTGGRVGGYERAANSAIDNALEELARKARELGANAVVGIDIDTSTLGNSMVMATAYGTAVLAYDKPQPQEPVHYLNPQPLG